MVEDKQNVKFALSVVKSSNDAIRAERRSMPVGSEAGRMRSIDVEIDNDPRDYDEESPKNLIANIRDANIEPRADLPPTLTDQNYRDSALSEETIGSPGVSKNNRLLRLWLAMICVILIAATVSLTVVLSGDKQASSITNNSNTAPGAPTGETSTVPEKNTVFPTAAPTQLSPLLRVITTVSPPHILENQTTPQAVAAKWLLDHEDVYIFDGGDQQRLQRYALAVLGFSMFPNAVNGPLFGNPIEHECEWLGVTCGEESNTTYSASEGMNMTNATVETPPTTVTGLAWPQKQLSGSIPTEIGLLSSLEYLDLGENNLTGPVPEDLFSLSSLQELYIQDNQLQGTLSENFGNLAQLRSFYGGNNLFSGHIPQQLGSPSTGADNARPLRYLSLHRNQLNGTIPANMNLRQLFYMDLSFNSLSGPIPTDWMIGSSQFASLRNLYLDHNRLSGPLSEFLPALGGNRLKQLYINDNLFTGTFPGGYQSVTTLLQLELHHNSITAMDSHVCKQAVFEEGELVMIKADCGVCPCKYLCDQCY